MLHITEKMTLLHNCGLQIWLCLFTLRHIKVKQLNRLTAIETFSFTGYVLLDEANVKWTSRVCTSRVGNFIYKNKYTRAMGNNYCTNSFC